MEIRVYFSIAKYKNDVFSLYIVSEKVNCKVYSKFHFDSTVE